jgi:hypothetical protein
LPLKILEIQINAYIFLFPEGVGKRGVGEKMEVTMDIDDSPLAHKEEYCFENCISIMAFY